MPFTLNMATVNNGLLPDEGPFIAAAKAIWGYQPQYPADENYQPYQDINLQSQAQTGRFSRCQSVWVDNSANGIPVSLESRETGHTIYVPAFTQGMYPIICSASPNFRLTLLIQQWFARYTTPPPAGNILLAGANFPAGSTQIIFLNAPQRPYTTSIVDNNAGFSCYNVGVNIPAYGAGVVNINSYNIPWSQNCAMILYSAEFDIALSYVSTLATNIIGTIFLAEAATNMRLATFDVNIAAAAAGAIGVQTRTLNWAAPLIVPPYDTWNNSSNTLTLTCFALPAAVTCSAQVNLCLRYINCQ